MSLESSEWDDLSLADFDVLSEISRSSAGAVYKARRKSNGVVVALKERKCAEIGKYHDILHEVSLLSKLRHPNIVRYYGHFFHGYQRHLFIILEYAKFGDLHSVLSALSAGKLDNQSSGPRRYLPEPMIWHMFSQISAGLAYIHSMHIAHRDIKALNILLCARDPNEPMPANAYLAPSIPNALPESSSAEPEVDEDEVPVNQGSAVPLSLAVNSQKKKATLRSWLFSQHWVIKIADLGVGRKIHHEQQLINTFYGTPLYLSPEMCRKEPYTLATDVWSLGVLLHEMCALTPPFHGGNILELSQAICTKAAPPLPAPFAQSFVLRRLLNGLLAKQPSHRPPLADVLQFIVREAIPFLLNPKPGSANASAAGKPSRPATASAATSSKPKWRDCSPQRNVKRSTEERGSPLPQRRISRQSPEPVLPPSRTSHSSSRPSTAQSDRIPPPPPDHILQQQMRHWPAVIVEHHPQKHVADHHDQPNAKSLSVDESRHQSRPEQQLRRFRVTAHGTQAVEDVESTLFHPAVRPGDVVKTIGTARVEESTPVSQRSEQATPRSEQLSGQRNPSTHEHENGEAEPVRQLNEKYKGLTIVQANAATRQQQQQPPPPAQSLQQHPSTSNLAQPQPSPQHGFRSQSPESRHIFAHPAGFARPMEPNQNFAPESPPSRHSNYIASYFPPSSGIQSNIDSARLSLSSASSHASLVPESPAKSKPVKSLFSDSQSSGLLGPTRSESQAVLRNNFILNNQKEGSSSSSRRQSIADNMPSQPVAQSASQSSQQNPPQVPAINSAWIAASMGAAPWPEASQPPPLHPNPTTHAALLAEKNRLHGQIHRRIFEQPPNRESETSQEHATTQVKSKHLTSAQTMLADVVPPLQQSSLHPIVYGKSNSAAMRTVLVEDDDEPEPRPAPVARNGLPAHKTANLSDANAQGDEVADEYAQLQQARRLQEKYDRQQKLRPSTADQQQRLHPQTRQSEEKPPVDHKLVQHLTIELRRRRLELKNVSQASQWRPDDKELVRKVAKLTRRVSEIEHALAAALAGREVPDAFFEKKSDERDERDEERKRMLYSPERKGRAFDPPIPILHPELELRSNNRAQVAAPTGAFARIMPVAAAFDDDASYPVNERKLLQQRREQGYYEHHKVPIEPAISAFALATQPHGKTSETMLKSSQSKSSLIVDKSNEQSGKSHDASEKSMEKSDKPAVEKSVEVAFGAPLRKRYNMISGMFM